MRKLIYGINMSLDGCCDHTKFGGGNDIQEYFRQLLEDADLVIYGRKTYELMVPFWPEVAQSQSLSESANAFARTFAKLDRVLVSRTIASISDKQTTLIGDNLKEEILRLKQQPGKAISTGGVELPAQLIAWGLVDEFHIVVHPGNGGSGPTPFCRNAAARKPGLKVNGNANPAKWLRSVAV